MWVALTQRIFSNNFFTLIILVCLTPKMIFRSALNQRNSRFDCVFKKIYKSKLRLKIRHKKQNWCTPKITQKVGKQIKLTHRLISRKKRLNTCTQASALADPMRFKARCTHHRNAKYGRNQERETHRSGRPWGHSHYVVASTLVKKVWEK